MHCIVAEFGISGNFFRVQSVYLSRIGQFSEYFNMICIFGLRATIRRGNRDSGNCISGSETAPGASLQVADPGDIEDIRDSLSNDGIVQQERLFAAALGVCFLMIWRRNTMLQQFSDVPIRLKIAGFFPC